MTRKAREVATVSSIGIALRALEFSIYAIAISFPAGVGLYCGILFAASCCGPVKTENRSIVNVFHHGAGGGE